MERGVGGGRENPWEILGNSGWGGESGRGPGPVGGCCCSWEELRQSLLAMPQRPCNGNWRMGVGLGMTGDLVTVSTGDLLLLFLLLPAVEVPQW